MGNIGSNNSNNRRRYGGRNNRNHHRPPTPPPYYQYPPGPYYPPPPPVPAVPHHHYHQYPPVMQPPTPYVDHQKTVTIKNDVNLKKETLKIEADQHNPGMFLVSFTFDANVACSITLYFFAREGEDFNLTTTKENSIQPITVTFQQGLGLKFKQAPGTGIDLSTYEESDLLGGNELSVYPLVVKAEATPGLSEDGKRIPVVTNSQITDAVFEKVKGEYKVRVAKQILWVSGIRYEMLEIYGIGNSADANDPGKECVICLSEPRDTTVLPCRHMCMCNGCAKLLRFQTKRCPICRQPVERHLEIKVNNGTGDWLRGPENTLKRKDENE